METPTGQTQPTVDDDQQLASLVSDWLKTMQLRFRGSLHLAMAETKLAVSTFVLMMFLAVISAGSVVLGWAFLLFAAVQALELTGVGLIGAFVLVGVGQFALAFLLWRFASRLSRHMEFRATRGLMESE